MKKITKQAAHSKVVENIVASLRIEQLTPSDFVVFGMRDCISGKNTTVHLLEEVKRRHVTLRHGR